MFTTVLLLGLWKRPSNALPAALSINVLCLNDKYVQIVICLSEYASTSWQVFINSRTGLFTHPRENDLFFD